MDGLGEEGSGEERLVEEWLRSAQEMSGKEGSGEEGSGEEGYVDWEEELEVKRRQLHGLLESRDPYYVQSEDDKIMAYWMTRRNLSAKIQVCPPAHQSSKQTTCLPSPARHCLCAALACPLCGSLCVTL